MARAQRKPKPYTVTVAQQVAAMAPAPYRLYTYTFYNPAYRQCTTLDCIAQSQAEAFLRAQRFLRTANERDQRISGGRRQIRMPTGPHELRRA